MVFVRQLWSQPNRTRAFGFLADWIALARVSGNIMLEWLADTLEAHEEGILAYYDCPISTGPLYSTNNKSKP